MEIREIITTEYIDICWELLMAHREELATYKNIMELKPDREQYKLLEDSGRLVGLGVFDDDNNIVGYSVTILTHTLHYADLKMAANDVIYLRKDLRGTATGIKLIKATEDFSKKRLGTGPILMTFHGKPNTSFSNIMPRLEYGIQDIVYSKVL